MRVACHTTDCPVWRLQLSPDEGTELVLFSEAGLGQLIELLGQAEASGRCRLVVLEGAEGCFCRGVDLDAFVADPERHAKVGVEQYAACVRAIRGCSKVVVALVDGTVLAGGVGMAAAADVVVATERSSFGLPELVVGLVPAMVLPVLCERMPAQRARRLALSAVSIGAAEAAEIGLIDELVPGAPELHKALRRLAKQVLRASPNAVAELKQLMTRLGSLDWSDGVGAGAECTARLLSRSENVAAVAGFGAGEPMPWFERYRPDRGSD